MSEIETEEQASALNMALAGCSILWILCASLVAAFLVALGTFACGAICDQMAVVWMIAGIVLLLLLGFCLWLFIAMIRRRISPGLFMAMLGIDFALLIGLVMFATLLGAG